MYLIPTVVIRRPRSFALDRLEANDRARGPKCLIDDLLLFSVSAKPAPQEDAALAALDNVDPDALSPRQAQEALNRLREGCDGMVMRQASLTRPLLADLVLDPVENYKRGTHFTAIALTMPFLMHRLALAQTLYEFVQALRRDG